MYICISTFRCPASERTYLILSRLDTRQFASLDLRQPAISYRSSLLLITRRSNTRRETEPPRTRLDEYEVELSLVRITYQFWIPVSLIQDWIICICAKIKISVVDFFLFQSSKINSSTIRSIETSIWLPFVISMQTTLYFVFKRIKSLSLGEG